MTGPGRDIAAVLVMTSVMIVVYLLVFYGALIIIDLFGLNVIADVPAAVMT
jgi:hypothetical protein